MRQRKARGGKGIVTCVDKANVFASLAFFRKVFDERATGFPDIRADHAYVDATALDFDFLASRFALAGGHIRAIVFHACLQCAEAGAPRALTMHAIIRAVQREYEKLERASSLEQFGPYAPLVASERSVR